MRTPGSPEELEQLRLVAGRMFELDLKTKQIAHAVGRDEQTVRAWRRAWKARGMQALKAKVHPGPKRRMTDEQWHAVIDLLGHPPRHYGLDAYLWTAALIGRLIQQKFGVSYHHDYVGEMLHKFRFSPQRPAKQARERDQAAIDRWVNIEWPALLKKASGATG